jgi:hypothetical protein
MDGDERRKVRFGGGSSDEDEPGVEMQERKVPVLRINNTKGQDKYKDLYVVDSSSDDDDDDENDQDQVRFRLPVRRLLSLVRFIYIYLLC